MNLFHFKTVILCTIINVLIPIQYVTASYGRIMSGQVTDIQYKLTQLEQTMETNQLQSIRIENKVNQLEQTMETLETNQKYLANKQEQIIDKLVDLQQTMNGSKNNTDELLVRLPLRNEAKLLKYLKGISGSKTISGLYVIYTGAHRNKGMKTMQSLTGKLPGIVTTKMPSSSDQATKWQGFVDEAISNWINGSLVQFVWWNGQHPLISIREFQSTNDENANFMNFTDLIENGGVLNREWKNQLDLIVPYFKQLEKAGVVPICDFLPLINRKSSTWRGRPGILGSSQVYKITRDYLTINHGLNSIIYVWSVFNDGDWSQWHEFWPGDNYVDAASVYVYNTQTQLSQAYPKLLEFVGDKPISLEFLYSVPEVNFFIEQPRWTWFSVYDYQLQSTPSSSYKNINATFNSDSVINRGSVDYFEW